MGYKAKLTTLNFISCLLETSQKSLVCSESLMQIYGCAMGQEILMYVWQS